MAQECLHTEVCQSGTEKYRGQFPFADQLLVKFRTGAVQKFNLLQQLLFLFLVHNIHQMRIVQIDLFLDSFLGSLHGIGKSQYLIGISVVNSAESLSGTDRPVDRACGDSQLFFDFIQKIERIVGIPVHFVDKGKDRNMTHHADLKQFSRLCLDTLGTVDHHDRGIRCHQGTVSIL